MDGMFATFAALLGAVIGGLLSVLASWLAGRVQAKSQWVVQEVKQREQLYSQFVEAASRCYSEALQESEPDTAMVAKLYADMGRMRLVSSEPVVAEANLIAHRILDAYADQNHSKEEVRDLLSHDSIDLFSDFADACRAELARLQPLRMGEWGPFNARRSDVLTRLGMNDEGAVTPWGVQHAQDRHETFPKVQ